MIKRFGWLLAPAVIACSSKPPAVAHDNAPDSLAIRQALDLYVAAVKSNDPTAVRAAWVAEPIWMAMGAPTVRGSAAFDAFIKSSFTGRHVTDVAIVVDELTMSGDLAFLSATYSETFTRGASEPQEAKGRFMFVWHRESDGSWKVARGLGLDAPS